eukprot:5096195-Amphidinium_carterae.2
MKVTASPSLLVLGIMLMPNPSVHFWSSLSMYFCIVHYADHHAGLIVLHRVRGMMAVANHLCAARRQSAR